MREETYSGYHICDYFFVCEFRFCWDAVKGILFVNVLHFGVEIHCSSVLQNTHSCIFT